MKKLLRSICLLMIPILLVTGLCSCSGKNSIVGQWYDSDGDLAFEVKKDGTYDTGGLLGKGKWKYLDDDETIEFTDFYGYTKTTKVEKDDLGLSILGIIFGVVGQKKAKEVGATSGLATAGLVCGIIGTAFSAVGVICALACASSVSSLCGLL